MFSNVKNIYGLLMANEILSAKEDVRIMQKILSGNKIKLCFDCNPEKELLNFCNENKLETDDLLIIHYSGHGERKGKKINGKISIVSTWINPDDSHCYSFNIDYILSRLKCKIILLSDSCYSGNFGNFYYGKSLFLFIGSSSFIETSKEYNIEEMKTGILIHIFKEIHENIKTIHILQIQEIIKRKINLYKIKIKPVIKVING